MDKYAELTAATCTVYFSLHKYVNEQYYLRAEVKMCKYSQNEVSHAVPLPCRAAKGL